MGPNLSDRTTGLRTRSSLRGRFGAATCPRVEMLRYYYREFGPPQVGPRPHVCYLDLRRWGPGPRNENKWERAGNYLSRFSYHTFITKTRAGAGKAVAKTVKKYMGIRTNTNENAR